jgi:hypothetical protein
MTSFPKRGRGVKTMITLHDFPFLDTCSYIILAGIMFNFAFPKMDDDIGRGGQKS